MKKLTYLQSAIILTGANMLTNVIGFLYRIFLTRSISVEGVGLYQLVLPIYSLFIALVSGGISTAISKVISVNRSNENIKKIVRVYAATAFVWSAVICMLVIAKAEFIARYVLKDIRTMPSIIIFAPAIIFIAVSAVIKGYFYGIEVVAPPALIDVVEKLTRLVVISVVTTFLIPYGIVAVCAGALFSMTAGELISLLLLFAAYRRKQARLRRETKIALKNGTLGRIHIVKTVTFLAFPLAISGALNTIIDIISAMLIPRELELAGLLHKEALALYGQLTGMAVPLAFFPFIIITSLSTTLIPAIASSYERHNWDALNKKCRDAISISTAIAFFSILLLLPDPHHLCDVVFKCADAGNLLYFICFGIFFEYLQQILFAILNAVGKQALVLRASLLNISITLLCIFTLIPIKSINVYGYIIGFIVSGLCVFLMCLRVLLKLPEIHLRVHALFVPPLLCFLAALAVTEGMLSMKLPFLVSEGVGMALYMLLLLWAKVFSPAQIKKTIRFR